jgi:hypothetical protein
VSPTAEQRRQQHVYHRERPYHGRLFSSTYIKRFNSSRHRTGRTNQMMSRRMHGIMAGAAGHTVPPPEPPPILYGCLPQWKVAPHIYTVPDEYCTGDRDEIPLQPVLVARTGHTPPDRARLDRMPAVWFGQPCAGPDPDLLTCTFNTRLLPSLPGRTGEPVRPVFFHRYPCHLKYAADNQCWKDFQ